MSSSSIEVFACDHRYLGNEPWLFDVTRLGTGFSNDCKLKDTDGESICTPENNKLMSEYTAIWWIWKHIKELGDPDYVGFCHYRRFFTLHRPNYGAFPICCIPARDEVKAHMLELKHIQLLEVLQHSDADGILPVPFIDYSYASRCEDVVQLMYKESQHLSLGLSLCQCNDMFNLLKTCMLKYFSANAVDFAFKQINTFHFNLFVLSRDLFELYSQIMSSCMLQLAAEYQKSAAEKKVSERVLAYCSERFSSCIFIAMAASGKKFALLPMLMVDNKQELS